MFKIIEGTIINTNKITLVEFMEGETLRLIKFLNNNNEDQFEFGPLPI